jgi:hypothetical protein
VGTYVYVKNKKTKPHELGHWSEKKKLEAVTLYIALGNLRQVSTDLNVPYETVCKWKSSDWWKEYTEQIQSDDTQKLDTKLSKALDKALDAVMDRIENGEFIYDQKTGKLKRAPAKLRDANAAFNSLLDKRQLIRKLPTKITEASDTAAKLANLAEQFAKFATGKAVNEPTEKLVNEFIEEDTVVQGEDGKYYVKE